MSLRSNSLHARDIAYLVHPQTNLRRHVETGPSIFSRGEGIYVYDDSGNKFLEGAAGLWCASLGFGVERLAKTAVGGMRDIGYYHIYRSFTPIFLTITGLRFRASQRKIFRREWSTRSKN